MVKEKKNWKQYKVLFEPADGQRLEDDAHASRLPVGVFLREFYVTGTMPKEAPPLQSELTFGAKVLLKICYGLVSNLTQLEGHAKRLGGPLLNLVGPNSSLQRFAKRTHEIGMGVKLGELNEQVIEHTLVALEPIAHSLNDDLALPLNEGKSPLLETWKEALTGLQSALFTNVTEVQK